MSHDLEERVSERKRVPFRYHKSEACTCDESIRVLKNCTSLTDKLGLGGLTIDGPSALARVGPVVTPSFSWFTSLRLFVLVFRRVGRVSVICEEDFLSA
jgi:hypothetical protein